MRFNFTKQLQFTLALLTAFAIAACGKSKTGETVNAVTPGKPAPQVTEKVSVTFGEDEIEITESLDSDDVDGCHFSVTKGTYAYEIHGDRLTFSKSLLDVDESDEFSRIDGQDNEEGISGNWKSEKLEIDDGTVEFSLNFLDDSLSIVAKCEFSKESEEKEKK